MRSTTVTNGPASPEGLGLEIDKMSRKHVASHFDAFIGEILRRIPPEDRRTFKVVVQDSYETGGQNWTDDMAARFGEIYGLRPRSLPAGAARDGRRKSGYFRSVSVGPSAAYRRPGFLRLRGRTAGGVS